MKYKGKNFDAIVATPCCGKSFLCDKYPEKFVDVDEVRLRCKYIVPEGITRNELEKTKGQRTFARKAKHEQYVADMKKILDMARIEGKILIAAPHSEVIEYFVENDIKFAFVYQNKNMKNEIERRFNQRGTPQETIDKNISNFENFYKQNQKENKSVVHYEFGPNEYLESIIEKFGVTLNKK